MKKNIIYELNALYREPMQVTGYEFGTGEKSVCVVGSMRGNEVQQMFSCSNLIRRLKELEARQEITEGKSILVIPCINSYSMNIGKRFWATDNTDINRMFPGYDEGETTQRIAAGLFQAIQGYSYGIQFPSFYLRGRFCSSCADDGDRIAGMSAAVVVVIDDNAVAVVLLQVV